MPPLLPRSATLALSLLFVAAACAQTPPDSQPASAPADYDPILQKLHDRDATLTDFTADIKKQDYKTRTDDTEMRTGKVTYVKDAGITKIAIHFDQYVHLDQNLKPDMPTQKLSHDLIFDGQFGISREDNPNSKTKIFRKQQLLADQDVGKVNPLKLGEGLFANDLPLPIGQDPNEIKKNFTVTLLPIDPKTDPNLKPASGKAEDLIHLKLVPKIPEAFSFKQLDLFIDLSPNMQLPQRIIILNKDKNPTTIDLNNIKTNHGGTVPDIFVVSTPAPSSGWVVENIPYKK